MADIEVKIDYFSATFPLLADSSDSVLFKVHETVRLVANYLNVKNFEIAKSKYAKNNYNYEFSLGEFIILRLDGPINETYQKTCHLEMKGEACRDFERRNKDKTWSNLIRFMIELNANFKRIDIAIDDFKGDQVTLGFLTEKTIQKGFYTSVFKSKPIPRGTLDTGYSLQFGSNDSSIQLVIYDKKMERMARNKECDKKYWVRYEMRFRKDSANKIALKYLTEQVDNNRRLPRFSFEQLYRIIDIKEDNNVDKRHMNRVDTDIRWLNFLRNVEKGTLPAVDSYQSFTSFETYLDSATPYLSMWLLLSYLECAKDPYIFELKIYHFMAESLKFSKQRFQKLNMYLDQRNLKTIDDETFKMLQREFKDIISERELPF